LRIFRWKKFAQRLSCEPLHLPIEVYMDSRARETITIDMPRGLEQIMPAYLAGRREEIPELIALLAASDFERLAKLSHNIRGTGTSYGFADLSRIGADLEIAAKQRDTNAASAQLIQLNYYLEHVQVITREVDEHTP
jgi:HPt (histidine-containing phosphotransfer) domain-containing protein